MKGSYSVKIFLLSSCSSYISVIALNVKMKYMFGITVTLLKLRSVAFAQITVDQRDLAKLRLNYIS